MKKLILFATLLSIFISCKNETEKVKQIISVDSMGKTRGKE